MQEFVTEHQAWIGLAILVAVFALFVAEVMPPSATATAGAALFLGLGYLDFESFREVFSNPAPITIGAMFVLSGALLRTGTIDALAGMAASWAETRPKLAIGAVLLGTAFASGIMNNTPVVLVLIPVMLRLATVSGIAGTRLLIPLSYMAVMGGSCTLIGTSTNLLVDATARGEGLEPFGIFEITPVGLVVLAAGAGTLMLLGPWLLPNRKNTREGLDGDAAAEFLTEARIPRDSRHVGEKAGELGFLKPDSIKLRAIRREGGEISGSDLGEADIEAGDRLVMAATKDEVMTLETVPGLIVGRGSGAPRAGDEDDEGIVVEAFVAPARKGAVRRLADMTGLVRSGVRVLAVNRHGVFQGRDLAAVRLRPADRLLLQGPAGAISAAAHQSGLISVTETQARPFMRRRAPVAVGALGAAVILAALGVLPIGALAILAVAVVLIARCIEATDAWQTIDASVMVLIFAMLAIGAGLEATGTVAMIVGWVAPLLEGAAPFVVLLAIFALASTLTEVATNNAVAVILTPIAVQLAREAGLDPRSLVMAVMFGASASFATPIGYQTNTLVYGAASYRFSDFLRIGVPLNIVAGLAACLGITWLMPLTEG